MTSDSLTDGGNDDFWSKERSGTRPSPDYGLERYVLIMSSRPYIFLRPTTSAR